MMDWDNRTRDWNDGDEEEAYLRREWFSEWYGEWLSETLEEGYESSVISQSLSLPDEGKPRHRG